MSGHLADLIPPALVTLYVFGFAVTVRLVGNDERDGLMPAVVTGLLWPIIAELAIAFSPVIVAVLVARYLTRDQRDGQA